MAGDQHEPQNFAGRRWRCRTGPRGKSATSPSASRKRYRPLWPSSATWCCAQAEVQNMRRRCEADVEKAHKFALEKFSGELLTVVDNLDRALNGADKNSSRSKASTKASN